MKTDNTANLVSADGSADAGWLEANRQHDDTYLRLLMHAKNWRKMAFFCLLVALIAVCGNVYIGSKSKFIPVLVEVDKLGRTVAVRAVTGEDAIVDPSRIVYSEMIGFIEKLRTVTTDRKANDDNLEKGFSRLAGSAREYVRSELRKAPANTVGATKTVQIIVTSALKQKGKTWQIEWEEHSYSLKGEPLNVENWRATVQYDLVPGSEEAQIRVNPIGFLIAEISWQKVTQ